MAVELGATWPELAERFRRGDEDALEEILRRAGPILCRVLAARRRYRWVALDELEEVVADALLAAFRVREGFDPARGSFVGWLFAFARNGARNFARLREIHTRRHRLPQESIELAEIADGREEVHQCGGAEPAGA